MNAAPELIPSALKMIAALAAVLGGLFVMVHCGRRYLRRMGGPPRERLVRVVASQPIGVKKAVALVEVPGCLLALGISGDRIQLLTRIDDPQVLNRIRAQESVAPPSFSEQLSRLVSRPKADDHED
jgi:flagellar biogenesis protein FliO